MPREKGRIFGEQPVVEPGRKADCNSGCLVASAEQSGHVNHN
jgi:hypothetical protein